ncbi:MAG: tetratricopeptide repeat protein [Verrucomicrobiota bacterium]
MSRPFFILALLFTVCLTCASYLGPWRQDWSGENNRNEGMLDAMLGDSRRLFANQIYAKADAYFHSGYYPSIFDAPKSEKESHLTGEHDEDHHEGDEAEPHHSDKNEKHAESQQGNFLGEPKDWIDRFGRNFFPSHHSHLGENGNEREILPWLRLSAELEPNRVDLYTVASYWLRSRLGKVKEAEQFLREGLRANPDSYEIYYELGRIYDEDRHDPDRARNLWEIALKKWRTQSVKSSAENGKNSKPSDLVYEGIVGRLSHLEENQGHLAQAIYYLQLLKEKSPVPGDIQKQIDELQGQKNGVPGK